MLKINTQFFEYNFFVSFSKVQNYVLGQEAGLG